MGALLPAFSVGFPRLLWLRILTTLTFALPERIHGESFYPYLGALCWIGMLLMLGR